MLAPRWLRVPHAVAYSGISRSKLYELVTDGQIKAVSVQGKGSRKGIRLIDRISLDEFLERRAG
jgi:excisionase family DNA binding protein